MQRLNFKKGDTVVEVIFAITIFCMIAVISIALMNQGVATAQGSLELSMVRNSIDAQAEGLRFIHNGYTAERTYVNSSHTGSTGGELLYTEMWNELVNGASNAAPDFVTTSCAARPSTAFVLNTRNINPGSTPTPKVTGKYSDASVFPRILYSQGGYDAEDSNSTDDINATTVASVEGIWIQAVKGAENLYQGKNSFYDFHIRACWYPPGKSVPSTIGTIVRLYNPAGVSNWGAGDF